VYVVNRTAVRQYFSGVNPIGKTTSGAGFPPGEIIGIVEDIRQSGPDAEPLPQLFMDAEHMDAVYGLGYYFVVRTTNDAATIVPAIRGIVQNLDPKLVVDNIATMNQIVANSITTPRSYAGLLGIFAGSALTLAMIGLYGVLAYFVTQRSREIGIRIALGTKRWQVALLILRQGLTMALAGLVLGLAGGAALTRYLEKMLFGVAALDGATFVVVSALFLIVTIVASYIPARQATNVDPLVTLRHE
jgi:ABC-type antimicrobial peptide transport system permease subunit